MNIEDRLELLESRLTNLTKHVLKAKKLIKSVTFRYRNKKYMFLVEDFWLDHNLEVHYTLYFRSEFIDVNKNSIYLSDVVGYSGSDYEFTEDNIYVHTNFESLEYEND